MSLPSKREEALAQGTKHYFTGEPCKNGHTEMRFTSSAACLICNREYQFKFYSTPSGRAYHRAKSSAHSPRESKVLRQNLSEIERFYADCPPGDHVDHIIPRHNKFIVGTHSLSNLQYLPADENRRKGNRIDPLTLGAVVCILPEYRSYVNAPDLQNPDNML